MRPAERALLRDRIRGDKTKWRLKLGRRAEKLIMREIGYSVRHLAMLTIVIIGVPDIGKSSVALALAELIRKNMLRRLVNLFKNIESIPGKVARVIQAQDPDGELKFYRPTVKFNFSVDDTQRQFAKSRLGSVISQDEDPGLMGKRSSIIKVAINNLLNQMREAGVSLIFCDPEMVEYVTMPNLIIEVVAKSEEHRICKCIVYDRKKVARGWANIRILDDDHPLVKKYKPAKTANVQKKRKLSGFDSARIDWKEFKLMCKKAIEHVDKLEERGDIDPYTCPMRQLEIAILSSDIPGDQYLQQGVLDTVKAYYRKSGKDNEDSSPATVYTDDLIFDPIRSINELRFLRKIACAFPHVLQKRKERGEKMPDKFEGQLHAAAWYLKYKGQMNATDIGRYIAKFHPEGKPVSQGMINNKYKQGGYPAIFQHEVSGECNEFAIWQEFFPEYEWVGGHEQPDLVKGEHWIECKLRHEGRKDLRKYVPDWQVQHLKEGYSVMLVVTDYTFGRCTIEFYHVKLKDEFMDEELETEDDISEEQLMDVLDGSIDIKHGKEVEILDKSNTD